MPKDAVTSLAAALSLDATIHRRPLPARACASATWVSCRWRARPSKAVVKEIAGRPGPREALAEVYTALGERQRAIDQLEALSTLDPDRPERLVAVGLAHANAGRDNQAIVTLESRR
jgi:hypothetical protein